MISLCFERMPIFVDLHEISRASQGTINPSNHKNARYQVYRAGTVSYHLTNDRLLHAAHVYVVDANNLIIRPEINCKENNK